MCLKCGQNIYSPEENAEHTCEGTGEHNHARSFKASKPKTPVAELATDESSLTHNKHLTGLRQDAKDLGIAKVLTMPEAALRLAINFRRQQIEDGKTGDDLLDFTMHGEPVTVEIVENYSKSETMEKVLKEADVKLPRGRHTKHALAKEVWQRRLYRNYL